MKKTDVCPGNLAEGFDRYCPRCIRQLFDGKRVSPIMDFDYDADDADLSSAINRILVSGVQEKLSAILSDGKSCSLLSALVDDISSSRHRHTSICGFGTRYRLTNI